MYDIDIDYHLNHRAKAAELLLAEIKHAKYEGFVVPETTSDKDLCESVYYFEKQIPTNYVTDRTLGFNLSLVDDNRNIWVWSYKKNNLGYSLERITVQNLDTKTYLHFFDPQKDNKVFTPSDSMIEFIDRCIQKDTRKPTEVDILNRRIALENPQLRYKRDPQPLSKQLKHWFLDSILIAGAVTGLLGGLCLRNDQPFPSLLKRNEAGAPRPTPLLYIAEGFGLFCGGLRRLRRTKWISEFHLDNEQATQRLKNEPVVTEKMVEDKTTGTSALKITRIDFSYVPSYQLHQYPTVYRKFIRVKQN